MSLWKRKRIVMEYNALEESYKRIKMYEDFYKISSKDFYKNQKLYKNKVFDNDRYLWISYIKTYIKCGGILL